MSATPLGLSTITAAQRVGSAHAGLVSLGGNVPAVKWATMDSHTASVSARSGHPDCLQSQMTDAHLGQGFLNFIVLETLLGTL